MPREGLYPEGSTTMNVVVPTSVKAGISRAAKRQRQSASALVTVILEDWLLRRGEVKAPEREEAAV